MGLDSVELVMGIEEKFGITISDEEACSIYTVGEMHQCVMNKVKVSNTSSCLTQRAFHLLRRNVLSQFGISRRRFTPNTELDVVIPKAQRRKQWLKLQHNVGAVRWPALCLSKIAGIVLITSILVIPVLAAWYCTAKLRWSAGLSGVLVIPAMASLMVVSRYAVRPFETEFPAGLTRVRDLAYPLVADNPQLFGSGPPTWTDEEVWSLLCSVIKTQTGATHFTKDSCFVADLGID